jgi:hypothetical protein
MELKCSTMRGSALVRKIIVGVTTAVLVSLVATPAANAAPAVTDKPHCVVALPAETMSCYATFTEAISSVTHGAITDAPADGRTTGENDPFTARIKEYNAAALADPSAAASVVLSKLYWDAGLSGNSLAFTGGACDTSSTSVEYSVADLGKYTVSGQGTWNNKTSSINKYYCNTKMYDNINFGGAQSGWYGSVFNLGDIGWNDRASSLQWS